MPPTNDTAGHALRPYRGPLKAVMLDWAGTVIDYGSRAPAGVFVDLFKRHGIPIAVEQARRPMGAHKRDHIAQLLGLPAVDAVWQQLHGRPPSEDDLDALYREMTALQIEALPAYSKLIPGALDAVAAFRARGLRVGSGTGYNRAMMDVVTAEAKRQGLELDCVVTADDVPAGRPHPYMCYRNMIELEVYPAEACLKVGDTVPDVLEGLNAGMWMVAVAKTGNEVGLSDEEIAALPPDQLAARLAAARERLGAAGAHYTVESIAGVPALLDEVEARLARGERP